MAEPRQVEPHALQVEDINDSLFRPSFWDARFTSCDFHMFPAVHALSNTPLTFILPQLVMFNFDSLHASFVH